MDNNQKLTIDLIKKNKTLMIKKAEILIGQGVEIKDPERIDIRGELICGKNVNIDINVIIEGKVFLGNNVTIEANCILIDSSIDHNSSIKAFSLIEGAVIGENTFVGPYGRIRPGTTIEDNVQIGNFVEIKNSVILNNGRVNHLSFIGDAHLDSEVTIGAGTITCNHDGQKINQTFIGKGAYIGSGCNLIAPIKVGNNATIGAGSTVYKSVPKGQLTVARSEQVTVKKWHRTSNKIDNLD